MGAIAKQLWISRECRKLVSHKLQRRLVIISVILGVSVFLIFLGGLMWALIAANRDPSVSLGSLKYVSYGFFGVGGVGTAGFCLLWLVYVRDAKFEIHQQELRHAPDMFRFPTAIEAADPSTQLTDLHSGSRANIPAVAEESMARPEAVVPPGRRLVSDSSMASSSWTAGVAVSVYDPSTPVASSSTASASSERPLTLAAGGHWRQQRQQQQQLDLPPRPRAVSNSEAAIILEPSALQLSRPSSVTTSSSKERFIV